MAGRDRVGLYWIYLTMNMNIYFWEPGWGSTKWINMTCVEFLFFCFFLNLLDLQLDTVGSSNGPSQEPDECWWRIMSPRSVSIHFLETYVVTYMLKTMWPVAVGWKQGNVTGSDCVLGIPWAFFSSGIGFSIQRIVTGMALRSVVRFCLCIGIFAAFAAPLPSIDDDTTCSISEDK